MWHLQLNRNSLLSGRPNIVKYLTLLLAIGTLGGCTAQYTYQLIDETLGQARLGVDSRLPISVAGFYHNRRLYLSPFP